MHAWPQVNCISFKPWWNWQSRMSSCRHDEQTGVPQLQRFTYFVHGPGKCRRGRPPKGFRRTFHSRGPIESWQAWGATLNNFTNWTYEWLLLTGGSRSIWYLIGRVTSAILLTSSCFAYGRHISHLVPWSVGIITKGNSHFYYFFSTIYISNRLSWQQYIEESFKYSLGARLWFKFQLVLILFLGSIP